VTPVAADIIPWLVAALRARGSWCDSRHMQKAVYLLQELGGCPLEYDFILRSDGPYSSRLQWDITDLLVLGVLKHEITPYREIRLRTCANVEWASLPPSWADAVTIVAAQIGAHSLRDLAWMAAASWHLKHKSVGARSPQPKIKTTAAE
jgi:hypothetical protein